MRDLTVAAALGWTCHVKKIPEDLSFKAFSPWRQVHYKESTVQIGATGTPFAGVPLKPERNLGAEDHDQGRCHADDGTRDRVKMGVAVPELKQCVALTAFFSSRVPAMSLTPTGNPDPGIFGERPRVSRCFRVRVPPSAGELPTAVCCLRVSRDL